MRPAETKEGSDGEALEYDTGEELDITGIDDVFLFFLAGYH